MTSLFEQIAYTINNASETSDKEFNDLALALFEHQFTNNSVYHKICSSRGKIAPTHWSEIPCLSSDLFKTQDLLCGDLTKARKTFISSGTSQKQQSKHYLSENELTLYEESLWKTFSRAFNLFKGKKIDYFVLTNSPQENANSSLIHMFETVRKNLQKPDNCYFVKDTELQTKALEERLRESIATNTPVLLAGTAFSFVHLLDSHPQKIKLPSGSAIMETGGFKGKSREIPRAELYKQLTELFEIPENNIVGQYGMSELSTQYYDACFNEQESPNSSEKTKRFKSPQSWSRVRIVDPNDLAKEVGNDEIGLIAHYDLANIDSLAFVLSGDLGVKRENNQFEVIGRASQLAPKGCSLTSDLNLSK
jgi:hypothetical protein